MKRRSGFFIAFATAVLTFGTLRATLGPARFNHHFRHHHRSEHCGYNDSKQERQIEKPQKEQL